MKKPFLDVPRHGFLPVLLLTLLVTWPQTRVMAQPFVHPGGLHTLADLDRMKTNVAAGNHPWIDDWNKLIADGQAGSNYNTHVQANMGSSRQNADLDAHAAYLNALRWYISGNANYANKATNILNSWAAAVNVVPSGTDVPGLMGIAIFDFALAGEVLRVYPGWKASDFAGFTNMMVTWLYPSSHSFLTSHNGACISSYWANWDACNIAALIAMGVLCDSTNIYNEGVNYFKTGTGMGSISNAVPYLYNGGGLGQWQESGRDQEHAQLGVGLLGSACQVAWNQGLDLFAFSNNRLLAGAEYVAQCNLSHPISSIPYTFYNNCANARQCYLSINGLGNLGDRPVWELLYNHYVVRQGLTATNCQAMAQLMRPEHGSIDHFGYGTLAFTLNAAASPYPPSPLPPSPTGLTATPGVSQVFLEWNPSNGDTAQGYNVRRATTSGGPYTSIASGTASTAPKYTDTTAVNGTTYYYVVAAINQSGTSGNSAQASAKPAAAGSLPSAWLDQDVGTVGLAGSATYASVSGNTFIVKGAGSDIGGTSDSFNFAYGSVTGDFSITGRLANVSWAGNDKVGLMMRESLAPAAKTVAVTLGQTGVRECYYLSRSATGGSISSQLGNDYTWLPVWFKLQRSGNTFTGSQSLDGTNWFTVGSSSVTMASNYLVGVAVCSRDTATLNTTTIDNVTTDGVTLTAWPPPIPTGLWASAANSQVTLTWTASTGATSNNVKRATVSGGPYTTIATVGAISRYTDTSPANGTKYYYVISALNGFGESADSSEVSAIPNNSLSGFSIGTAGSYNSLGNTITNVFDDDLSTFFDGPDASGDWAGLDFGAGVSNVINQIAYCPRTSFAARMVGGVFQGANVSDFSSGVVTLFTVGTTPAQSIFTFQPITNFTAFRYVRYLGPANGNCNVAEVKFYGNSVSTVPPQISFATSGGQLQLAWPADRTGWRMQVQTNSLGHGTNWMTVSNSNSTNQMSVPINPLNGSVFFRLTYP